MRYAGQHPGGLNYGSSGIGSFHHLSAEVLASLGGIKMTHIPYKAPGPAIIDLLTGRIQVFFAVPNSVLPYVKSGKLKLLAVTSAAPSDLLPGVPTVADTLPDYRADNWFGVGLPTGTPQVIADRLNAEVNKLVKDKAFAEKLISLGFQPVGGSIDDMKAAIRRDRAKWKKVIEETGMRAE